MTIDQYHNLKFMNPSYSINEILCLIHDSVTNDELHIISDIVLLDKKRYSLFELEIIKMNIDTASRFIKK